MTLKSSRASFKDVLMALTIASAGAPALADRTMECSAVVAAPVAEVWKAYTTNDGFASWAVAKAEIDLRIGGDMSTHYNPNGVLGDDGTIINRILAFEPQRMLTMQNTKAPKSFKNAELFQKTWTVLYFEPVAPDRTNVRCVGLGWGDGPEWDGLYKFFSAGNAQELAALQNKFAPKAVIDNPGRVMTLLGALVGGEWIHEGHSPDGRVFRVRNLFEHSPDGKSLVSRGWLGSDAGMRMHSASMIWLEPGVDGGPSEARFQSISETGGIARGAIRLAGDDRIEWDWNEQSPEGKPLHFRVAMNFTATDKYAMKIEMIADDGAATTIVNADFTRVDKAPEAFLNVREKTASAK